MKLKTKKVRFWCTEHGIWYGKKPISFQSSRIVRCPRCGRRVSLSKYMSSDEKYFEDWVLPMHKTKPYTKAQWKTLKNR